MLVTKTAYRQSESKDFALISWRNSRDFFRQNFDGVKGFFSGQYSDYVAENSLQRNPLDKEIKQKGLMVRDRMKSIGRRSLSFFSILYPPFPPSSSLLAFSHFPFFPSPIVSFISFFSFCRSTDIFSYVIKMQHETRKLSFSFPYFINAQLIPYVFPLLFSYIYFLASIFLRNFSVSLASPHLLVIARLHMFFLFILQVEYSNKSLDFFSLFPCFFFQFLFLFIAFFFVYNFVPS